MAREIAIGKRAKISKAQQYTLIAVLATGVIIGAAISLIQHFTSQISFNSNVITEEDKAILAYSDTIKNIGICKKPAGTTYTNEELKKCNPNTIDVSSVPNTLRSNIMEDMAANPALNSVPKENTSSCINPTTKKAYTYEEMEEIYKASGDDEDKLVAASELIQSCSALRVIPDALPAFKNEEALLSSLNKIFLLSDWEPESLSPTGTSGGASFGTNLSTFSVRLSIEAGAEKTRSILSDIERSIREFDVQHATIEWGGNDSLILQAQATAYYTSPSTLNEITKTIKVGDKK